MSAASRLSPGRWPQRERIQAPELAHPLAELGRLRIHQRTAAARQAQQFHADEGHA
jgi:hypothetical protein